MTHETIKIYWDVSIAIAVICEKKENHFFCKNEYTQIIKTAAQIKPNEASTKYYVFSRRSKINVHLSKAKLIR